MQLLLETLSTSHLVSLLNIYLILSLHDTDLISDSPELFEGAPCCIQVVGKHMREEELVQATQTIANVLGA